MPADGKVPKKWVDGHDMLDKTAKANKEDYILSYQILSQKKNFCVVIDVKSGAIKELLAGIDLGEGSILGFITEGGREIICENLKEGAASSLAEGEAVFFGQDFFGEIGAENMFYEESGAYTGEIAPNMLTDIGVKYVILGHSERREYFAETDETVNKKVLKAFEHGITPIICCGESLTQREQGVTMDWIRMQIKIAFLNVTAEQAAKAVIAYEPIWAIGTGVTATTEQAEEPVTVPVEESKPVMTYILIGAGILICVAAVTAVALKRKK